MSTNIQNIVENQTINNWLNEYEGSSLFEKVLKMSARKPFFRENIHKYYLATVGIIVFPILNIMAAHEGLNKIGEMFRMNMVVSFIIALLIPISIEMAQYATIKPLCKKIANKRFHDAKDYLDVIFFTLLIICITTFGLYTIANRVASRELFEFRMLISVSLALFFSGMTVYSHLSLSNFTAKGAREFIEMNPDIVTPTYIEFDKVQEEYSRVMKRFTFPRLFSNKEQKQPLVIQNSANDTPETSNDTSTINHIIAPAKPTILGFGKAINKDNNDNKTTNDTKKNDPKMIVRKVSSDDNRQTIIVGKTKNCLFCGKEFLSNHKKQIYCNDSCRIQAWELRNGKTLKKGKKGGPK